MRQLSLHVHVMGCHTIPLSQQCVPRVLNAAHLHAAEDARLLMDKGRGIRVVIGGSALDCECLCIRCTYLHVWMHGRRAAA